MVWFVILSVREDLQKIIFIERISYVLNLHVLNDNSRFERTVTIFSPAIIK